MLSNGLQTLRHFCYEGTEFSVCGSGKIYFRVFFPRDYRISVNQLFLAEFRFMILSAFDYANLATLRKKGFVAVAESTIIGKQYHVACSFPQFLN